MVEPNDDGRCSLRPSMATCRSGDAHTLGKAYSSSPLNAGDRYANAADPLDHVAVHERRVATNPATGRRSARESPSGRTPAPAAASASSSSSGGAPASSTSAPTGRCPAYTGARATGGGPTPRGAASFRTSTGPATTRGRVQAHAGAPRGRGAAPDGRPPARARCPDTGPSPSPGTDAGAGSTGSRAPQRSDRGRPRQPRSSIPCSGPSLSQPQRCSATPCPGERGRPNRQASRAAGR